MAEAAENDLKSQFSSVYSRCTTALNAGGCSDAERESLMTDLVRIAIAVDRSALFSKNEELDDISTESLKYLYIDYYQGKLHTFVNARAKRKQHLQRGKAQLERFISRCNDLRIEGDNSSIFTADQVILSNVLLVQSVIWL